MENALDTNTTKTGYEASGVETWLVQSGTVLGRCREVDTKIGSFFHVCQTSSTQKQYEGPTVK